MDRILVLEYPYTTLDDLPGVIRDLMKSYDFSHYEIENVDDKTYISLYLTDSPQ